MTGLIVRPANLDSDQEGRTVLLGFLDLVSSIETLKHDWYQRRAGFSQVKIRQMVRDMVAGASVPPITLGMRGDKFDVHNDSTVILNDPVYIIDGLQRWSAAMLAMEQGAKVRLAVHLYFNTEETFEIALFRELNTKRTGMAPSIHIRNEKSVSRIAGTLYGMSINEPKFALLNRVCWDQRSEPEQHLINGMCLLVTTAALHHHHFRCSGLTGVFHLLNLIDERVDLVGLQRTRENLVHFFDTVDTLWGIRSLRKAETHLKSGWLITLARMFSDLTEFWKEDDKTLFVPAQLLRDLKRLDPKDDEMARLAGGSKSAQEVLYQMFLARLNKGKVNKLIDRYVKESIREAAE
jgi:hypothetical protein